MSDQVVFIYGKRIGHVPGFRGECVGMVRDATASADCAKADGRAHS